MLVRVDSEREGEASVISENSSSRSVLIVITVTYTSEKRKETQQKEPLEVTITGIKNKKRLEK